MPCGSAPSTRPTGIMIMTTGPNRNSGTATRLARSLMNACTPRRSTSTRAKKPAIKKNADIRNM